MSIAWTENATFHASATLASGMEVTDAIALVSIGTGVAEPDYGIARVEITFPTAPTQGQVVIQPWTSEDGGVKYEPAGDPVIIPVGRFTDVLSFRYYVEDPRMKLSVRNETNQNGTYVGIWAYRVPS